MSVTATPPAMARSNQKPAPTVERVMVASDDLFPARVDSKLSGEKDPDFGP